MDDQGTALFKGTSPEECEEFVATIRQRALTKDKHFDNEWMAVFASSHFVGDALYWHEGLDVDVQNDWNRLRRALLARFGRVDYISATTSGASSTPTPTRFRTIPTPAAAPPRKATEKAEAAMHKRGGKPYAKDKCGPKRPLSPFMYYCKDWRDRVKAENPEATPDEVAGIIGMKWKELDDSEKAHYIEKYAKDKARYEGEEEVAEAAPKKRAAKDTSDGGDGE